MDKKDYDERLGDLIQELNLGSSPNAATDSIFIDTVLWNYFKKIRLERLNEACEWLKENYDTGKWYKFPQVFDFRKGLDNTRTKTFNNFEESKQPTGNEQEQVREIARMFANKFSTEDLGKYNSVDMLKQRYKDNQIFSIKLWKWVDKSQEKDIGGNFSYPEERLLGSGIKREDLVKGIE